MNMYSPKPGQLFIDKHNEWLVQYIKTTTHKFAKRETISHFRIVINNDKAEKFFKIGQMVQCSTSANWIKELVLL